MDQVKTRSLKSHGTSKAVAVVGLATMTPAVSAHSIRRREFRRGPRRPREGRHYGECKTGLSPREREVLMIAAQGQRAKQIARTLYLSPHTVRNHLKNSYRVLGAHDLADALLRAVARGDISLPVLPQPEQV